MDEGLSAWQFSGTLLCPESRSLMIISCAERGAGQGREKAGGWSSREECIQDERASLLPPVSPLYVSPPFPLVASHLGRAVVDAPLHDGIQQSADLRSSAQSIPEGQSGKKAEE